MELEFKQETDKHISIWDGEFLLGSLKRKSLIERWNLYSLTLSTIFNEFELEGIVNKLKELNNGE